MGASPKTRPHPYKNDLFKYIVGKLFHLEIWKKPYIMIMKVIELKRIESH